MLYLGADNKLYYSKSAVTINNFHGYLKLTSNLVMGEGGSIGIGFGGGGDGPAHSRELDDLVFELGL